MDIDYSPHNYKISENLGIRNEFEYFKLFLLDDIVDLLLKEYNNYLLGIIQDKYGQN